MDERSEWVKLDDVSEQIRAENWSLYWAEAKSESDRFERLMRDPLSILAAELDEIEDDWHVISQFINHHIPHHQSWVCRVVMVMPEIKTALLTYSSIRPRAKPSLPTRMAAPRDHVAVPEVQLSAGPIEYGDSGGEGRPLVLIGGLPHDEALWDGVVAELAPQFRCLTPVLPLGAQRKPLRPDADLSLPGLSRIVTEFLERLDLSDAVVCFNDWGGAQTMISQDGVDRVGAFVLVSCETDDNYPPGVAGRIAALSGFLPGGFGVMRFALSTPGLRRLPFTYGRMSKRGVPDELMRRWLQPLKRSEIRRDTRKYVRDVRHGRREIRAATPKLRTFERPVLVVWDEEGTMMPNSEGRRLAESFPDSTYIELPDCYTLIPIDQPVALADEIRRFAGQ